MIRFALVIPVMLALVAAPASATTWATSSVKDPVSGRRVKVQEPVTSGGYIYQWPGKEDLVFWPATDENWLWFNPKTGYAAFGDDFENLEGEDLGKVRAWLAANYDRKRPPATRIEKLKWLEGIYAQRKKDEDFWCLFYRLMAYELTVSDPTGSLQYVRKAVPLLEQQLDRGQQQDLERIGTLYLLGEYNRRLGNADAARSYFDQAKSAPYKTQEGEEKTGAPYFVELIAEREALNGDEPPEATAPTTSTQTSPDE